MEERLMNILVIGNGFELAHGLPMKYGDFLDIYISSKWDQRNNKIIHNK